MQPNIAEFLLRILPWPKPDEPGWINVHWRSANIDHGYPGRPFRTLVELMDGVQKFQRSPKSIKDIYVCLSRQEHVGKADRYGHVWAKRHKSYALAMKCIALDVDVKPEKGYANVAEAMEAVGKFVGAAALPFPTAIVLSGGGLHCYWGSDRDLTIDEWTLYARGLRVLADRHQLRFDSSCTIDSARILRIPGTYNLKENLPREVRLKYLAPVDLDFERDLGHLRQVEVRTGPDRPSEQLVSVTLPPRPPKPELFTAEYQAEIGVIYEERPPLDAIPILKACPFFANTALTGGKGHEQGLWMQTALACTFMEHGREVFHGLSMGDPRYEPDTVNAMFDRKLMEREEKDMGWPQCRTFEQYGSQQCAGCPHRGKIRSPLNLSIAPAPSPKTSEPVLTASVADELWMPRPYYLHPETGFPTFDIEKKAPNGSTYYTPFTLLNYKITAIWPQADVGINFTVNRGFDKPMDLVIKYEDLTTDTTISTAFAKQKVTTHHPKELAKCMKTLIEEYQRRKKSLISVPFGWWIEEGAPDPGGWAYNGIIRKEDGTTMPASKGDAAIRALYTPRGSMDTWFKALKLITEQHRPDVEVITAVAFASPLLRFTGHFSGALVARSDSGGNKSTAVNVGGAVWGHPRKTKFAPSASNVGIRLRLAQTNNLPCYWDDIRKEHVEAAAALLSDLTQGVDGTKAKQNRDLHETGSWQAILCVCANGSLFDHFVSNNRSDAAGLYRIFEYTVSPKETAKGGRIEEWDATYLQQQLEENYGLIGDQYSQMLANVQHMKELLRFTQKRLAVELGYVESEQERFWMALVSTIILGAKLANEIGASFNVNEIHQFLLTAYRGMREKLAEESLVGEKADNAAPALTAFLQEYSGNALWSRSKITKPGRGQDIGVLRAPPDDEPIFIHWVTGEPELRIQTNKFTEFLKEKHYTRSVVFAALRKHFNARTDLKASLNAGTQNAGGGSMHLITMPIPPGSEFEGTLRAHEPTKPIRSGLLTVVPKTADSA